ncbi:MULTISPECIES: ATP-binding protein [Streptomyces]|jgi:anti-sigma regulatory factor (Ser/Thr protein kinase)|uniref:ATP-binding protein n=1 Tax=Streptomyces reniochalinae TaxID=2250578 RepID=A0A367EXE3_9ACTN|nr:MULTISPECIES: ATP-binding protein [Streptomyces]WSD56613.1 ATP-binding protein [Streptomyces albidoflavus]SCD76564.1 Anti-sigma regulatory factor (Ser/Thr protein kinase) [Streptomyces sp. IgraMP-1]MBK3381029.1 ATP-binding protein [Streptomyces sp. DEF147AK]MBK3386883.1 ATP-binding protein [Streptomyces sp. DEF1AK]RCG21830.1 ATP-binding protein [Streptomyces reniochalinae]
MPQPTTRARQTGHPGYSETLPRQPESAATARRLLRTACAVWGLDALAEDGALIVSELVANAVQHARRESIRVVIDRPGAARVRVGVADLSRARPVQREADDSEEGGRGLRLVAALAADWGTDERRWGKIVWADLEGRG